MAQPPNSNSGGLLALSTALQDRSGPIDIAFKDPDFGLNGPRVHNTEGTKHLADQSAANPLRLQRLLPQSRLLRIGAGCEPNNPIIANNLQLLNGSSRFIKRDPNYFAAAAAPPVVPAINPDAAAAPSDQ